MQTKYSDGSVGVIGGATKDAEIKFTPNGKVLAAFSLALGEDVNGNKKYVECEAWSRLAGICSTIRKADIVKAEGKTRINEYVNKNGEQVKKTILTVEFINIIHADDFPTPQFNLPQAENKPYSANDYEELTVDESDLPF